MELQHERYVRRLKLETAICRAIEDAIQDAWSSYDSKDAVILQTFQIWWSQQKIPSLIVKEEKNY